MKDWQYWFLVSTICAIQVFPHVFLWWWWFIYAAFASFYWIKENY